MSKYEYYTPNEIKPTGWLRRQLEIQAEGLNGNLDKVWRDIRDSKYVGGSAEGWERVPYWLDGFIPLAYLLDDDDMKARAKRYIDAIMAIQRPDGWICTCSEEEIEHYDTWAVLLISKVLTVYYGCSGDERIPGCLYRVMKNYYDLLSCGRIKLFDWGRYRWYEGFFAIAFLKSRYDEPWLDELADILRAQGKDYTEEMKRYETTVREWTFDTHIVNIGMMFKGDALYRDLVGREPGDEAERLWQVLTKYHGMPAGVISGDECVAGLAPNRGAELCSVVELMFSFETLYSVTGDDIWLDRLETAAFNALPATVSDDMWSHQYDQMSNQIACIRMPGPSIFGTNCEEAHLFGLEPNYGCCTANFGQGFPKLALSVFAHGDGVVKNLLLLPSELDCEEATVALETNYPFENSAVFTVKGKKAFRFEARIPSFAKNVSVKINGAPAVSADKDIEAGEKVRIEISFDTEAKLCTVGNGLSYVKKGSLVFALPIEYEKIMHEYESDGLEVKFPYCDYEYEGKSAWNYAFASDSFETEYRGVSDIPFSSEKPPVVLKAKLREIEWGLEEGYGQVCAAYPENKPTGAPVEEKELYPYGCAKLRITEMPF